MREGQPPRHCASKASPFGNVNFNFYLRSKTVQLIVDTLAQTFVKTRKRILGREWAFGCRERTNGAKIVIFASWHLPIRSKAFDDVVDQPTVAAVAVAVGFHKETKQNDHCHKKVLPTSFTFGQSFQLQLQDWIMQLILCTLIG